jgi:hypothetical protein
MLFCFVNGKTPWTGVALAAIQDSCLKSRYDSLVFVQLDKNDKKWDWLPDKHIRCILGDFTVEQLVGAIKSKVQERGGTTCTNKKEVCKRLRLLARALGARDPRQLSDQLALLMDGAYGHAVTLGAVGLRSELVEMVRLLIDAQVGQGKGRP